MIPETRKRLLLAGILLLTLIATSPIAQNEFINRDDPAYITENPFIKEFSFRGIGRIFSTIDYMADYHPLTLTLFSLEYSFFRDSPRGYHVVSIGMHLLMTALVFAVIRHMTGSLTIAGITAAFFGVHPTHIESVAWASEQKDLLYGILYLCSLLAYLHYIRLNRSRPMYFLSLAAFALALLAKMMAAPLALVLLVVDVLLRRPFTRNVWLEKIPFFLCAILFGGVELYAHREIGTMLADVSYGFDGRIVLASYALVAYIGLLILPVKLSAYYPFPFPPGTIPGNFIPYVLVALLLVGTLFVSWRYSRKIFFGIAFFLLNIVLILQFVPAVGAFMADRYTYVASIGLLYLFAEGVVRLSTIHRAARTVIGIAVVVALLACAVASWNRAHIWRSGFSLWSNVLERYPDVAFIYVYRANARPMPSDYEEAVTDIRRALQLQPDLGVAYYSLAYFQGLRGDHRSAISNYTKSIELRYQLVKSYSNRGSSRTSLGKYREAIDDYSAALRLDSSYADALFNRGNVYMTLGEFRKAIDDYTSALKWNPSDGETLYNRGIAKSRLGDVPGACIDLKNSDALRYQPARAAVKELCR